MGLHSSVFGGALATHRGRRYIRRYLDHRRLTTPSSFELRTFGGLAALRSDGRPAEGAGGQKRRLALLALVDAAGERGISRDKLLGYLWPESEPEKARGALAQALYALKKGLGYDDLFSGTNEIHLNRERLASDRAAFLAALARGDREGAVGWYAGPYLDGFYLSEATEFERWVEMERASLAHDYVAALQHLAAKAEAERDAATAVKWWRKLVAVDPLNGALTSGLVRALADAGDRAGALRQAQIYQSLMEAEFEEAGDPAVSALVEELQRPTPPQDTVAPRRTMAEQLPTAEVVAAAMRRPHTSRAVALAIGAEGSEALSPERRRLSVVTKGLASAGYTIEREIGAGGMATVYLAHDTRHDRHVAIKILHEGLGASVGAERFLTEIKTTARLQHPHILPLLDSGKVGNAGESDALLFYVMPFFQGETLRDRLNREKQLPIDDVVRLTRQIAEALGYAHEQGIVHRDIKPENILLQRGHALVADFGIALAVQTAGGDRLTKKGLSLGTPEYMAPEQATASAQVDQRADIYALGAVAYEMLTGDPPFTGSTMHAVVAKALNERPIPPRTVRDTVPPGVEAAVLTALAKLPADRFSQASDFTRALAEVPLSTSGARQASVVPPLQGRRRTLLGVGAGGVALAVLAAVALMRRESAPLVLGAVTQVTRSTDTLNFDAAISPDGRMVAYASGSAGQMRLFVRQVSGSAPVWVSTGLVGDHRWPRWSPDGERLAFVADSAIYLIPALGGAPQLLVNLGSAAGHPAWSPDGTQLAYADSNGISVVAATGGVPHRVVHRLEAHAPTWSPDGRRIAYAVENLTFATSANYGNAAPSSIWSASAAGGDSVLVADASHQNATPLWWPDGRSILFVSDRDGTRDVYRQPVDRRGVPRGTPDRVTSGLGAFSITLSSDGSQMAYSSLQLRRNIWMAPIAPAGETPSSVARAVTNEKQAIEGLAISHDGKWLVYDTNRDGNLNIYKVGFNGRTTEGDPLVLTRDVSNDYQPRWSASDDEIVFYSPRFGTRDVFTVSADGRREARITNQPGNEYYPDWSPDGRSVVFSSQVSFGWDVFTITRGAEGAWSTPKRLAVSGESGVNTRWSPDGRTIAVVSDATLKLVPVDGGAPRSITTSQLLGESITFVAWGQDASQVFLGTRDSAGIYSFWSAPTAAGSPRRVLRLAEPGRRSRRPEFDTDGKNLFFTVANDEANVAVVSLKQP